MTLAESELLVEKSANHHGRHDKLITIASAVAAQPWDLDAIIVPTGRKAPAMKHSIELAAKLHCTLVALCSKWSIATEVVKLARQHPAKVIIIDATDLPPAILPRFKTSELLTSTRFNRTTDTSQKRNLGLLLARLYGWRRVVFLDDDITIPDHEDLRMAAWLTEEYAGVGLAIDVNDPESFPDNSVVCHAYRDAGGDQGMFIGGGALAAGSELFSSFFPNIYNEDWFFLLGEKRLRPVTLTGRALQRPYDPFEDRRRAQAEELGDCLAEGLFWLLDAGGSIADTGKLYWAESLKRRRDFIAEVVRMVTAMKGQTRKQLKMLNSLQAARARCVRITPTLCDDYVSAWQEDRERWRGHLDMCQDKHGSTDVEQVLSNLGLASRSRYLCS